jgi:hypothetical protein
MNAPGAYPLTFGGTGDFAITSAGTMVGDWIDGLDGMQAVSLQLTFAWGSGGTAVKAYLQTVLDGDGTTAVDIACVTFGTAGKTVVLNLSGLTPRTTAATPSDGALADDTCLDGILGDRLRLKLVVTGTYGGSTVLAGRFVGR